MVIKAGERKGEKGLGRTGEMRADMQRNGLKGESYKVETERKGEEEETM